MAQSYGGEARKEEPLDELMSFKSFVGTPGSRGLQVASRRPTELMLESGPGPAMSLLSTTDQDDLRYAWRHFASSWRPKQESRWELPSEIGRRLAIFPSRSGPREMTCIADAESLTAQTITLSRKAAREQAERDRPGLSLRTDGSRTDLGGVGYAVVWRPRHSRPSVTVCVGGNYNSHGLQSGSI